MTLKVTTRGRHIKKIFLHNGQVKIPTVYVVQYHVLFCPYNKRNSAAQNSVLKNLRKSQESLVNISDMS